MARRVAEARFGGVKVVLINTRRRANAARAMAASGWSCWRIARCLGLSVPVARRVLAGRPLDLWGALRRDIDALLEVA